MRRKPELGTRSVRRNPLIADLLHRIEFIEKAGTGIKRIRDEVKKHGSPEPVFEATGFFTAIFRPLKSRTPELTGEVTGEVSTKSAPSQHQVSTKSAPSQHQVGTKWRVKSQVKSRVKSQRKC